MQHHDDQVAAEENSSEETSSVGQQLKAAREALELPSRWKRTTSTRSRHPSSLWAI
jgi:hypothetical protein